MGAMKPNPGITQRISWFLFFKEVFFLNIRGRNELDQREVTLEIIVNYTTHRCYVCQLEC